MTVIATRKREKDISYVLGRNILLAISSFIMGSVLFSSNPSYLPAVIISAVLYLLMILLIGLGIKDYKFNKRINELPEVALYKHYSKLVICNEEESTISIKDIQKIKSRRYIKTAFGLAHYISKEGVLIIKTKDKLYKLESIEEVKKIHKFLEDWMNEES